jgi:2-haloacid dehalogenase
MIDAVVFDIGNVLIRWDVRALYRTIFDDPDEMEWFLAEVWTPAENLRCDRGEPFAEVIAEVAARHPRYEPAIHAAWDRWIETIPGAVPGSLELLEELDAAGVPTFALSNFSAETFPLVRDRYPHFRLLGDIVISGDHPPLAKPDPEFYELLCERTGIAPERTVFVDDSPVNTEAAAALGFTTVDFTDTDALRRELRSLGLPVSDGSGVPR